MQITQEPSVGCALYLLPVLWVFMSVISEDPQAIRERAQDKRTCEERAHLLLS